MAKFERRESEIVDIFDTCIDRLMAGETLDTVLADYPDYADELRSLLETGLLVQQVQSNGASADEISAAQQQGRDKVVAALGSLPETEASGAKRRRPRILQWVAMAAAAAFAMGFGITLGVSNSLSADVARGLQAAANEVAVVATIGLTEVMRPTDVFGAPLSTATVTATPTVTVTSTVTPMPTMTAAGTEAPRDASSVINPGAPLATPGAVGEETDAGSGVYATATELARMLAGGMTPVGGLGGGDGASVGAPGSTTTSGVLMISTEVASFYAMTPTPALLSGEAMPVEPGTASADGTRDEAETDIDGYEAVPPVTTDGETTSEVPPPQLQDFRNVQLQPLKAGEIDDNADWDTYTEYRRNYMAIYPFGVIDLDVGGRQIIEIVDSTGKPILGAKVQVYSGATLIAETTTYATGMTLFFPNADPAFSRMDTFRVVVSKNGVTIETTLDIKRLDDTLTITLQ